MKLSKPIYEFLPYFYMVAGTIVLLVVFLYGGESPGSVIYLGIGYLSIVGGAVLWLKRRGYRRTRERDEIR